MTGAGPVKVSCPVCRLAVRVTVGTEWRLYTHKVRGAKCLGSRMRRHDVLPRHRPVKVGPNPGLPHLVRVEHSRGATSMLWDDAVVVVRELGEAIEDHQRSAE